MIEALASPTRIVETDHFSAVDLDYSALCLGVASTEALLLIIDPRPLEGRDRELELLSKKRKIVVLDKVVPDPKSADINFMASLGRDMKVGCVIGIGGGSTLDSAKAVRFLLTNEGRLDEYLGPSATRKADKKGPPLILIPTTAGTGSEVTRFGVYTAETGRKFTLVSELLRADAAVLCTELVANLPAPLVAAAGFDALTHALETLWNKNATPLSDALATEAAAAVLTHLLPAFKEAQSSDPRVQPAARERSELLRAANKAGIAFDKTGTAAIHALSFVLSEEWHIPHGSSCAFFTEAVFKMNSKEPSIRTKLAALAARLELTQHENRSSSNEDKAVSALYDRIQGLRSNLGLANSFSEIPGFKGSSFASDTQALCKRFNTALSDPKMKNNVVSVDEAMLDHLVKAHFEEAQKA